MNISLVDKIVSAVLYEGYILYPYRPSVKNHQRWTFGGLYPEAYCQAQLGADSSSNQNECLVHARADATIDVTARFLHLTQRIVGALAAPVADWHDDLPFRAVESLRLGEQVYHPWQEAEERQVELQGLVLGDLQRGPRHEPFAFAGQRWFAPLGGPDGGVVAVLLREQQAVRGAIDISATAIEEDLVKVTVRVVNEVDGTLSMTRDEALLRALVSTHTILGVTGGEFVSLLDPPAEWKCCAEACSNIGTWPVLVGARGVRDTMLSSPIILYDYPQIAPESPGDLFDGTEIDEILTLRILTLTDEEKQAALGLDSRARDLMQRTEAMAREQLYGLHGTLRALGDNP
jgi:hypothetical protein